MSKGVARIERESLAIAGDGALVAAQANAGDTEAVGSVREVRAQTDGLGERLSGLCGTIQAEVDVSEGEVSVGQAGVEREGLLDKAGGPLVETRTLEDGAVV